MKHEIYMLLNYFYYSIKKAQHEMHDNIIYSPPQAENWYIDIVSPNSLHFSANKISAPKVIWR